MAATGSTKHSLGGILKRGRAVQGVKQVGTRFYDQAFEYAAPNVG